MRGLPRLTRVKAGPSRESEPRLGGLSRPSLYRKDETDEIGGNMYTVYILKSKAREKYYTGMTDNIERRLIEHNNGKSIYTKRHLPWEIIYTEEVKTRNDAVVREKYLKSAAGRRWIKSVVQKSE